MADDLRLKLFLLSFIDKIPSNIYREKDAFACNYRRDLVAVWHRGSIPVINGRVFIYEIPPLSLSPARIRPVVTSPRLRIGGFIRAEGCNLVCIYGSCWNSCNKRHMNNLLCSRRIDRKVNTAVCILNKHEIVFIIHLIRCRYLVNNLRI